MGHHAAVGQAPARQRLDAVDPAIGVALRLVVQLELIAGKRFTQVGLELQPLRDGLLHHRIEEAYAVLALALGFVQGAVGLAVPAGPAAGILAEGATDADGQPVVAQAGQAQAADGAHQAQGAVGQLTVVADA